METTKSNTILAAKNKIKSLGFRVFFPKSEHPTYLHYSDGERVAYLQTADFDPEGVTITTVHVPSVKNGSGFRIGNDNQSIPVHLLTLDILNSGFVTCPNWAINYGGNEVKKYSMTQWLKTWSGTNSIEAA